MAAPNHRYRRIRRLYTKQLDALTEKDTLILAGSIPSSLPSDMYELIMERLLNIKYSHRSRCYKCLLTKSCLIKPFFN